MRALTGTQQAEARRILTAIKWERRVQVPDPLSRRPDRASRSHAPIRTASTLRRWSMGERVIRTEKHVTIIEAHPYHRYVSDDRPGGNAIVERAYDPRCPRCREEAMVASERDGLGVTTDAK